MESFGAHRGLVVARDGAVAASQPLAVSAGISVLAQGGTFADAAIAVSAVLCVIEPYNSHLGGDAFLVVYDADRRETVAFNGSGAAPRSATPESYASGIPVHGVRAASVPGLVSTWAAFHNCYGKLPLRDLLQPAIGYARDGYPAGPRLVRACQNNAALFAQHPSLAALNLSPNLTLGQIVRQPDLSGTLEQIAAHGADAFYRGPIAEKIAAASSGHFTAEDLATHHTRIIPPLRLDYRSITVHGQPPPSQGYILLSELGMVRGFDLANLSAVKRNHRMIEAKKLAFADRNCYLADPEKEAVPIETLLSEGFLADRRRQIRPETASPDYPAGDLHQEGSDTTYFLVADRNGNAVSFIQSIFHSFGSATVLDGTGILLNNRMTGFSLDSASPNCLAPGKRPVHTLNAWLATHPDGSLAYVGGTPGGHVQVQTNLQLIVNLVDGGMNPQEAIEAPRWQHLPANSATSAEPSGPGTLEFEERIGESVLNGLREHGHDVQPIGAWAHGSAAQILSVLPNGAYTVGSDPRCDGHAAAL
ncbi:MAG: gamma-glutamyltransferase family protein [Armatimonadaceae bacterium]